MGFRESFHNAVKAVTGLTKRTVSGEQPRAQTPSTPAEQQTASPLRAVSTPETTAPVVKNHRVLAREREQAAKAAEGKKQVLDKISHEELLAQIDSTLQEIQYIAPHLSEQTRQYAEGYQNEYNRLIKNQYENVKNDLARIEKNSARIIVLEKNRQRISDDLKGLEGRPPSIEDKQDTGEIIALGKRYGLPLELPPGSVFTGAQKLAALEQLHHHLEAGKKPSLKLSIMLVKCRKEQEENKIFDSSLGNMRRNRDRMAQEITHLTEENGHAKDRLLFSKKFLADFSQELNRFRNNIAERTSLPPDAP